jgi:hypothetical protein
MGEELKPDNTSEGEEVLLLLKGSEFSRRRALIYCQAQFNNHTVSLVEVSGNGQPRTYWMIYTYNDGHQEVYQTAPNMGTCGILHFQAMIE